MNIFEDKSDFEKLGVKVIRPYQLNGRWVFDHDGKAWEMAPAGLTEANLSPVIVGVDRLISLSLQAKQIDPNQGFNLLFSEQYFPTCDVKITFIENKFDGWLYNMNGLNLQVAESQQVWICPYLTLYFEKPPLELYLKIEYDKTSLRSM